MGSMTVHRIHEADNSDLSGYSRPCYILQLWPAGRLTAGASFDFMGTPRSIRVGGPFFVYVRGETLAEFKNTSPHIVA